ncbi:cytochrome P450 [Streptomyces alfalfae]|uniref:Cytochrome n=1 Tax=Streptomyces alfalfae TaxID=1642299 RepID=A0A1P8TBL1_9ACTN|nr:cytochrome P450 [Streptomyces alfalfae]AYA15356.1 cytochrome P450 [Streptomyces fradiae]APY85019.1 cytochrome [Streptomyces alfalfae]QQC92851.1 cytochrome P450 [Streptomyces alfalfae]QUI35155.1 cytochrome P450 [Streptomyces alfalfae]RXX48038.1 cytochrome P450 [Streptomyces alfalfae]
MSKPINTAAHIRRNGIEPPPELARISAETPLVQVEAEGLLFSGRHWLATGYDEVRAILGDNRFKMLPPAQAKLGGGGQVEVGNLLQYDPPDHTRLRKMLTPEFTLRRIRRLEPFVAEIAEDCLDALESAGQPGDLVRTFAVPIPGLVGCALLGVPRDDAADLARNFNASRAVANFGNRIDDRERERQRAAGNAFVTYMRRLVRQKRRTPGDDLLSMLIRDHGADITDEELTGTAATLMGSGIENVGGMLALAPLALLQYPDQLALLLDRPELIDRAVEELIRYLSSVPNSIPRYAGENLRVGGHLIKTGELVMCSLLAVNRSQLPGVPRDTLDITRENSGHMAFGHGIHHCLGASLARMELRIGLPALLRRFPKLRVAVPPEEIRFRTWTPNYGVDELPVAW